MAGSTVGRSAAEWKAEGNALFAAKQFAEAAQAYTRAIELEQDAVFYSNRCACLLKLGDLDGALADALKLREMRPEWAKSHFREGSVLSAMGRYARARIDARRCVRRA
jgi:tetratricopeptide (TPR) repeat protein